MPVFLPRFMSAGVPPLSFFRRAAAYAVYAAFRSLESVLRILPLEMAFRLGMVGGWLAWLLLPGYRRLVQRNLAIAFGQEQSAGELRHLARRHFVLLGGNLLSSFKIPWLPPEKVAERVEFSGLEHAAAAVREGRGLIYALLHMGNWEILSQMSLMAPGSRPATMYQRLGNPYLNAHVERLRARTGCTLFDRREGFFGPTKWLRENGVIGILVDQHAGDAGTWCPFFGRLASTTNAVELLAQRTKAPILPLSLATVGTARWRLQVHAPQPTVRNADAAAADLNLVLEKIVRSSPADWFWVHNRWKTPNPAFLLCEYKRGVVLPNDFPMEALQPFSILLRSSNWLGDACMALPMARALRRGRPDAHLTVLTPAKLAGFWKLIPEVDAVLEIPSGAGLLAVRRLVRRSGRKYDAAVLLPNSLRTALEVWRNGIERIVGYAGHWRRRLLDQIIPPLKSVGPTRHHAEHYLRMAMRLGANVRDPGLYAPLLPAAAETDTGAVLRLGLCPGAEYGAAKRWPAERFAATARQIAEQTGCHWMLFGAAGDTAVAAEVETSLGGHCENLAGKTSLEELVHALRRCRLLLTNDTGAMHLAAALGVPVVAVFGSTDPEWTGPLGGEHVVLRRHVECSPCFLRDCPLDLRCMKEVEPEHAVAAVMGMLAGRV